MWPASFSVQKISLEHTLYRELYSVNIQCLQNFCYSVLHSNRYTLNSITLAFFFALHQVFFHHSILPLFAYIVFVIAYLHF